MATMTSTAPNTLPPRTHIPRLSYRTASDPNSSNRHVRCPSTSTVATSASDATLYAQSAVPFSPFTSPTNATFPDSTPGPNSPPSTPPFSIPKMPNKTKNKGSSLVNFFTVKEPSSQALADYEEYMRKQAASRGGRITAVGLPGVSSAKLPSTVPKVNSKWDGLPQVVKDREKERERRLSSSLSLGYRRPWSRSRSDDSFSQTSLRSSSSCQSTRRDGSLSISSQGHMRDYPSAPEAIRKVSATNNSSATEPTPSGRLLLSCSHSGPSNLPSENLTHEHSQERSCDDSYFGLPSLSTSPGSSAPGTPVDPSPVTPLDLPPYQFLQPAVAVPQEPGDGFKTTVLELSSDSTVLLKSAGPNILGPPANAKRGFAAQLVAERETVKGVKPHPILRKGPTPRPAQQPTRPPLSSYFPHTNQRSSRSTNTSQIKPVGPNAKNYAVTPWEVPDSPPTHTVREQDSTPPPLSGEGLRRKSKMSLFSRSP